MTHSAQDVAAAAARLREAGAELRSRRPGEVLGLLGDAIDSWCAPGSSLRRELEAKLPGGPRADSGASPQGPAAAFSAECVRAGLDLALARWSGAALRDVFARELGDGVGNGTRAFELSSIVLGGAIPMPGVLQIVLCLATGSPALVKPASSDPLTAPLVARELAEIDAGLGRAVEIAAIRSDDEQAMAALLASDCVVATGSDTALLRIGKRLRPQQRLVGYGHKLSLALVGEEALRAGKLEPTARALALDVALWDQLGCLSAAAIVVVGARAAAREGLAHALADELAALEQTMPRGLVPRDVAAALHAERESARLRAAAAECGLVLAGEAGEWTVVLETRPALRSTPLHRFVRIHPAPDLAAAVEIAAAVGPHLSSVALAGLEASEEALGRRLTRAGSSRLCAVGELQAPPLDWPHDGRPLLRSLVDSA